MSAIFHIRIGRYARAFLPRDMVRPFAIPWLWLRGWRLDLPHHWTKPSPNQRKLERGQ
jgi:hypothetical protein